MFERNGVQVKQERQARKEPLSEKEAKAMLAAKATPSMKACGCTPSEASEKVSVLCRLLYGCDVIADAFRYVRCVPRSRRWLRFQTIAHQRHELGMSTAFR